MKTLILGADGYCGWPTALRLSARGMDVTLVDNLSRRRIDAELGIASLVNIPPLADRVAAWTAHSGVAMDSHCIDVAEDLDRLTDLLATCRPDAIVHLAEQRSVPYSMLSPAAGQYTIRNNVMATTNLLAAMVQAGLDAHLVHVGSIGVYGYETLNYDIPEGYQKIRRVTGDGGLAGEEEVLHPFNPVSRYHLSKAMDHLGLAYYATSFGLRATELHQGTVWGAETAETRLDPRLANRFDYDAIYGTVLNRFATQAALGKPISVYGTGDQTRAFIHIEDVLGCIEGALATPPRAGDRVRVVNQVAQTMRIRDLARLFAQVSGCEVSFLPTPRREPEGNKLQVRNDNVSAFGIDPVMISAETVSRLIDYVSQHRDSVDPAVLYPATADNGLTQPA